jgi:hypothetical protein
MKDKLTLPDEQALRLIEFLYYVKQNCTGWTAEEASKLIIMLEELAVKE